MRTDIELVDIPEKFYRIFGEPEPGTRNYKAYGTLEEQSIWWDAFLDVVPDNGYSPGGAASYVGVSRTAVHKRIKEGRLSAFSYYIVKRSIFSLYGLKLEDKNNPSMVLIPVSELKQWRELMAEKRSRGEKVEVELAPFDNGYSEVWATPKNWREKLGISKK